jgi:hypothetical protein
MRVRQPRTQNPCPPTCPPARPGYEPDRSATAGTDPWPAPRSRPKSPVRHPPHAAVLPENAAPILARHRNRQHLLPGPLLRTNPHSAAPPEYPTSRTAHRNPFDRNHIRDRLPEKRQVFRRPAEQIRPNHPHAHRTRCCWRAGIPSSYRMCGHQRPQHESRPGGPLQRPDLSSPHRNAPDHSRPPCRYRETAYCPDNRAGHRFQQNHRRPCARQIPSCRYETPIRFRMHGRSGPQRGSRLDDVPPCPDLPDHHLSTTGHSMASHRRYRETAYHPDNRVDHRFQRNRQRSYARRTPGWRGEVPPDHHRNATGRRDPPPLCAETSGGPDDDVGERIRWNRLRGCARRTRAVRVGGAGAPPHRAESRRGRGLARTPAVPGAASARSRRAPRHPRLR